MWSSRLTIFLFLMAGGCSLEPLYHGHNVSDACDISVDVIAERSGQKLRSHLIDMLRDIRFASKKYRLVVKLTASEKQLAFSSDGNAKRVMLTYLADVKLMDGATEIFGKPISVSVSHNVAHAHGEVVLSLYGRHNDALLKQLAGRIIENIRMALSNEN